MPRRDKGWQRDERGRWYDENGFESWREAIHFLEYLVRNWREAPREHWSFGWGAGHAGSSGLCRSCPHIFGDHVDDWQADPLVTSRCRKCDCANYVRTPYRHFGISMDIWDQAPAWIFNFRLFSGTVYFW